MTAATFLLFTTGACLSYLSKVLVTVGFDPGQTGLMVASGAIPVVLCGLLAGKLLARFSARTVVALGIAMVAVGYVSLAWTARSASLIGPCLSLALMIGGMGLYMPSAFMLVRSCIVPERLMQFVGIYGAMQLLPSVFGPMWAQQMFLSYGLQNYFLITALPAIAGLVVLYTSREEPAAPQVVAAGSAREGYAQLLLRGKVALPCLGGLVAGSMFGSVNIFVALLLFSSGTPIHLFFVPFVSAYLLTRFVLLSFLERRNRAVTVGSGIGLMAIGVAVLWLGGSGAPATSSSAILFGCGFSMNYPVASVWISELFPAAERAKPVALFNSLYTFGMYASPLATGLLLNAGGPDAFYACVVVTGVATTITLLLFRNQGRMAIGMEMHS